MADSSETQPGGGLVEQLSGPFKGLGELMLWWDEYDRHARFAPAALAVSPLAVAVMSANAEAETLEAAGLAAFAQITLTALFAHTGRAQGDLDERSMRNNGDLPMQRWLCPFNRERSRAQVGLWHAALKNVTGIDYATAPQSCREYRRMGRDAFVALQTELRTQTPDAEQRPLHRIHQEEYGFARNLVGLLYLWAVTIVIGLFVTWYNAAYNDASYAYLIVQIIIAACWAVVWIYSDYFEVNGAERLTESLLDRAVAVFREADPDGYKAAVATPAPVLEYPSESAGSCERCGGRWSAGDVPSRPWPAHRMRW